MRTQLLAIGLLFAAAPAEAGDRPVVAVFTLKGEGTGFKRAELDSVSEYVSTQIAASGKFQVVPRSEVKKSIASQKKDSYKACYDESCQIEVGKELAAEKVVVGSIRKFGKVCMVNLRLFDLAKSASEKAGSARGGCGEDKVLASVDQAVGELTGLRPAVATSAPAAPAQPVTTAPPTYAAPPRQAPAQPYAAPTSQAPAQPYAAPTSQPPAQPYAAPTSQAPTYSAPAAPAPVNPNAGTLLDAGRALATTRHRRSYVASMAKMERVICGVQKDINQATGVVNATCPRAPSSRACARATKRVSKLEARKRKYIVRRGDYLTRAGRAEGASFAQDLDAFSRRVGQCWCDPARASSRACRVR